MLIADDMFLVMVAGGWVLGTIGSIVYVKLQHTSKSSSRVRNVVVREIKSVNRYEQTLSASQQNKGKF